MTRELDHAIGDDGLVHAWSSRHTRSLFECHWWAVPSSGRKAIGLTDDPVTCIPCIDRRARVR